MLTIVAQHAHGLRQGPSGVGVCGEAPVVHGEGGVILLILQVLVVLPHHNRPQHALHDGAVFNNHWYSITG